MEDDTTDQSFESCEERFIEFFRSVFPQGATLEEELEVRKIFYAGMMSFVKILVTKCNNVGLFELKDFEQEIIAISKVLEDKK